MASPARGSRLLVHYGCGTTVGRSWLNYDSSPSLRLSRTPFVGRTMARLLGLVSFPREVRVGNITKGLDIPDGSVRAVFASHVLEHLSYEEFQLAIANTFRMMTPGGTLRIVVPDLEERARRYLASARDSVADSSSRFMESTLLGQRTRAKGILGLLRQWFGGAHHLWMWDEPSMFAELRKHGFVDMRRCSYGDAKEKEFLEVESRDRFYDPVRQIAELAVEAKKPAQADLETVRQDRAAVEAA